MIIAKHIYIHINSSYIIICGFNFTKNPLNSHRIVYLLIFEYTVWYRYTRANRLVFEYWMDRWSIQPLVIVGSENFNFLSNLNTQKLFVYLPKISSWKYQQQKNIAKLNSNTSIILCIYIIEMYDWTWGRYICL